jgi:hypothetical protein
VDQYAKEGKDKKVTFEGVFSKPNSKPKWFLRKDVRNIIISMNQNTTNKTIQSNFFG